MVSDGVEGDPVKELRAPWASLRRLSVVGTLGLVAAMAASPVNASTSTTFNVPCGNIKLLEAAVGTPGATVNLAKGCKYQLTDIFVDPNGELDELPIVIGLVTINGHAATLLGNPSCPGTNCGRILEVGAGSPGYLTLNSVTITQGFFSSDIAGGGGLSVNSGSTAILNRSIVKNNLAGCPCGSSGGGVGGGIANRGTLKLNGSRVFSNTALGDGGGVGGGIYSFGTLSISQDSQVNGNVSNDGGGIFGGGTITLVDSSVSGNTAKDDANGDPTVGAGIYFSGGTLNLSNATVRANSVLKGGFIGGIVNGEGGGIAVFGGSVAIDQSQIRNNIVSVPDLAAAEGAGLFNNGGTVSFVGGAIESNAATNTGGGTADGGGVFNASGTVTRSGTTVTSNTPDNWS
jgi:hypothetical protein